MAQDAETNSVVLRVLQNGTIVDVLSGGIPVPYVVEDIYESEVDRELGQREVGAGACETVTRLLTRGDTIPIPTVDCSVFLPCARTSIPFLRRAHEPAAYVHRADERVRPEQIPFGMAYADGVAFVRVEHCDPSCSLHANHFKTTAADAVFTEFRAQELNLNHEERSANPPGVTCNSDLLDNLKTFASSEHVENDPLLEPFRAGFEDGNGWKPCPESGTAAYAAVFECEGPSLGAEKSVSKRFLRGHGVAVRSSVFLVAVRCPLPTSTSDQLLQLLMSNREQHTWKSWVKSNEVYNAEAISKHCRLVLLNNFVRRLGVRPVGTPSHTVSNVARLGTDENAREVVVCYCGCACTADIENGALIERWDKRPPSDEEEKDNDPRLSSSLLESWSRRWPCSDGTEGSVDSESFEADLACPQSATLVLGIDDNTAMGIGWENPKTFDTLPQPTARSVDDDANPTDDFAVALAECGHTKAMDTLEFSLVRGVGVP